jgi:hypothetical protein
MIVTVLLSFGRFHELSIPLAATLSHALVAAVLVWFTLTDVCHAPEVQMTLEPGGVLE